MVRTSMLLLGMTTVAGCGSAPDLESATNAGAQSTLATMQVSLAPTRGQTASGMLVLTDGVEGIRITGRLSGLPAGRQLGFHVHETGDCSAPDASSAGEHFNPTQQPHGPPGATRSHAGDMPNLEVDDAGVAEVNVTLDDVRIDAPADRSVRQRALIVHAASDDYKTQPSGSSGERIACGVIGANPGR
jgi:Cu-Zn family superoxide dismutase